MEQQKDLQLRFAKPEPKVEIHTTKGWRGVSVQFTRMWLPAEYQFQWDGHSHYLAHHDLIVADGEVTVLGEKPIASGDLRDQMTYVPAGCTIDGWARPANRLNAFTVVCFDPASMEEELQAEFTGPDERPHVYFKADELGATMRKLGSLMADDTRAVSKVHAETVGLTAALEMFRLTQSAPTLLRSSGQLTRAQMKLVQNYIEDSLARDIGLDDLASVCGLTRFHFARAFKATFDEPPYRYLNQRRVDRAKQMLVGTQLSIATIASACGFNGASQFGRSFRETVGQAPLEFRRRS